MTLIKILSLSSYLIFYYLNVIILYMTVIMISLPSWLWWWSHCHDTRCDFDDDLITWWWDHFADDLIAVIILYMAVLMMISSLLSYLKWLWWWSLHLVMTSLCWWSHCFHHTRYDFDDDFNTVIILDMTMKMILSHIKYSNSDEIFMIVTLIMFTEITS
jgi:hypothetical protein